MQCTVPRGWAVLAATAALAILPAAGAAAATRQQVDAAVERGASWLESRQQSDGSIAGFNGDWAVTGLAAAGVHAADVRPAADGPTLQDYWQTSYAGSSWGTIPNRNQGGHLGKAIAIVRSAGIDPARLAPDVNLVAALASRYDAERGTFGFTTANNDGFAVMALADLPGIPPALIDRVVDGVRAAQYADGGWTIAAAPGATSTDVDMTGAGLAVLCRAGADASDPQVQAALEWLKRRQDPETGGFLAGSFLPRLNSPTNAWALTGLKACGVDPQSAAWSTDGGANVVDFLLGLQREDGSFKYTPSDGATAPQDTNATEATVRALTVGRFTADPPARASSSDPVWRPVATVPDGTAVPVALAIDDGATAPRFCAVIVPAGSSLGAVLETARDAAVKPGCVEDIDVRDGLVSALNGVGDGGTWEARIDGRDVGKAGPQPVRLGDTIALTFTADRPPAIEDPVVEQPADPAPSDPAPVRTPAPPAATPVPPAPAVTARSAVRAPVARMTGGRRLVADRRGRFTLRVACPRTTGTRGACAGALRIRARVLGRWSTVSTKRFKVRRGGAQRVRVRLTARQRRHSVVRITVRQLAGGRPQGSMLAAMVRTR
jgi:hypothetical protein